MRLNPQQINPQEKLEKLKSKQKMNNIKKEKQKVISRNHWMFRLHKFCWNREARYEGYCPFFWNTWLNIGLLPLVVVWKGLENCFSWICDLWPEREEKIKKIAPAPDWAIVDRFEKQDLYYRPAWHHYIDWFNITPNWKDLYPAAKLRETERRRIAAEQEEKNKLRREKLEAKKQKIVGWLQYLVKPALAISALYVAYILYLFINWLIKVSSWAGVVSFSKSLGLAAIIVLAASIVVFLVQTVFKKVTQYNNETLISKQEQGFISKCFSAVGEGFSFVKDTIQIVYYKKCPLIRLTDGETRPIEKLRDESDG